MLNFPKIKETSMKQSLVLLFLLALSPSLFAEKTPMPDAAFFSSAEWVQQFESTELYMYEDEEGTIHSEPTPVLVLVTHLFKPDGSYWILVPESAEEYRWTWDRKKGEMTITTPEYGQVVWIFTLTEWSKDNLRFVSTEGYVMDVFRY
jgi:hypothetical protein